MLRDNARKAQSLAGGAQRVERSDGRSREALLMASFLALFS